MADWRGRRDVAAPSPFGDGLKPLLTVVLAKAEFSSHSSVKHGTQNIPNDYHQRLLTTLIFECIEFVFGRGSAPDPAGGAYSAPHADPLAGLRGTISKVRGGKRGVKGREEQERKGTEGTGPPFANSCIRPWLPRRRNKKAGFLVLHRISSASGTAGGPGHPSFSPYLNLTLVNSTSSKA